jgi:aminoglycoside phosphotransferase (APT) family kinase protein
MQQDVRLLRGWLARADSLILKMMLVRQLGHDLDVIAALHRAGLLPPPSAQPALSEAERSLEAPMRREFALVGSGLLTLVGDPQAAAELGASRWWLRWIYKPHMTVNDSLPDYQRVAANSRLDTVAFARMVRVPSRSAPSLWRRARNPVGTIFGMVAMPDFNKYLARLHDLDAKLALFNALGQAVPEADNPYRPGQRAKWDAKRQAYCFTGPLKDEQGVRCLPWPAPAAQ